MWCTATGIEDFVVVEGGVLSRGRAADVWRWLSPESLVAALDAGFSVEDLRGQVQVLGQRDPEAGHGLTEGVMRCAFEAIRDGHPAPQGLARVRC